MTYLKLAMALGVGGIAAMVPTSPVEAGEYDNATECRGRMIDYVEFKDGGTKYGQLQFYYSESENLYCAIMYHGGPTWNKALDTGVGLYKSQRGSNSAAPSGFQRGTYKFQAGPVGGRGECMQAGGGIDWKGRHVTLYSRRVCL